LFRLPLLEGLVTILTPQPDPSSNTFLNTKLAKNIVRVKIF